MMVAPYKIMKTQTEYLYLTIQTKFDKYNAQEYNMFYFFGSIISTSVSQNFKLMLHFWSTGCTPPRFLYTCVLECIFQVKILETPLTNVIQIC